MSDLLPPISRNHFFEIFEYQRAQGASTPFRHGASAVKTAHLGLLKAVSRLVGARYFVELGTGPGEGTRAFIDCAEETDGHVWSIDKDATVGREGLEDHRRVTFLTGDTVRAAVAWTTPVDVVYVDSDHSYAHALIELCVWSVHGPRVIFADDTLNENGTHGAPIEAVHDFCEKLGWRYVNVPVHSGLAILLPPHGV